MAKITKHNVAQRSDEWIRLRHDKITASSAGVLLTKGRGAVTSGGGWGGNTATERGLKLETEAIWLYERIKGVEVERTGFITNSDYPDCGYSPDGLLPDRNIEVKCFNKIRHGQMAFEILAQVHFGMMINQAKSCDVVFYNPDLPVNDSFIVVNVERDQRIINNIERALAYE